MAERAQYSYTVMVEAWPQGAGAVLDWTVYRARVGAGERRPWKRRRVLIRNTGPLSVPQLTGLAGRMAAFVLADQPGTHHVPRGLPWMEPGVTQWSVPPGGGEGGEKPAHPLTVSTVRPAVPQPTEGLIR